MKAKRILAALLAAAISSSTFAGCSSKVPASSESAPQNNEPVRMEWLVGQTSAEVNDDAEVVKMIEKRFNIDLKTWCIDSNKFQENLNVKFAGGEMPDVLVIDNMALLPNYVDGGIIHEIPVDMIRKKAPHYAKVADENDDGSFWSTMVYKGKNYGVPQPMDAVPMAMFWRKDWLDKLNLKAPTTLKEYEDVLTAFVEKDPDGDGKKNTSGMAERAFGAVFGAYGLRCVTGGSTGFKVEEMQLGKDNVPFFPYIRPEAKEALTLLNQWYKKGIVDKEFITGENHGGYAWLSHSFMNGQIGLTSAQPNHYFNSSTDTSDKANWNVCMKELKGLNPKADIAIGPAPVGPTGLSGTEGWNKAGRLTCLTTKAFEDPRKVDAFLAMLDAYYSDMDYARLVNFGIKGVHYEETPTGPRRLMEGTKLREEGVLQVDFGSTVTYAKEVTPVRTEFSHSVTGNGYYRFNAPPVEELSNVIATLDTLTEQAYFDMITGAKPVDYFDTFVKEFKNAGGEAAEKAVQAAYKEKLVS